MALSKQGKPRRRRSTSPDSEDRDVPEGPAHARAPRARDSGSDVATEKITSELLLDGQARLNLATFVTTWMPHPAER